MSNIILKSGGYFDNVWWSAILSSPLCFLLTVILFHKHMKDSKAEFKVETVNPLRIRLQKGTHGLKSDLYATVEHFFHDGAEDEHGMSIIGTDTLPLNGRATNAVVDIAT